MRPRFMDTEFTSAALTLAHHVRKMGSLNNIRAFWAGHGVR